DTYVKSYWITQVNAQGCEREPIEITLTLVDCPFAAPDVVGEEACQNTPLSSISAQLPSTTTEPVDEWKWYEADKTTSIANNSATYAHGVDNTIATTTTYYVSYVATEPISGNQCESPKTEVKVIVNPLPIITIDAPSLVCYDQGDEAFTNTVDYHENGAGTGVWSVVGEASGINSSGVFNPKFKGEKTDTYTVDYTYTDGKGCVNNKTHDITVQFTPAPVTQGHIGIISTPLTVEVSVPTPEATATINWYETQTSLAVLSSDNPWETGDDPLVEVDKLYWATQTVQGCER